MNYKVLKDLFVVQPETKELSEGFWIMDDEDKEEMINKLLSKGDKLFKSEEIYNVGKDEEEALSIGLELGEDMIKYMLELYPDHFKEI